MNCQRAPAVSRAIRVLKVLGSSSDPLGVNAIAKAIGVVPSSCLHILRALAEDCLVHVEPETKRYSLGLGLLTLAHDMMGRNHFAKLAQPELEQIARRHGVTATAVELDERERMVVVAMAQGSTLLKIQVGLGSRFPAYISATGRCVAAHSGLTRAQLKQRFTPLQWDSAPEFEDWLCQVEAARKDGVAVDPGNYICGFTIVAALVYSPAGPKQAVSIIGVSEQLGAKALAALKRDTTGAARKISAQLHGLK